MYRDDDKVEYIDDYKEVDVDEDDHSSTKPFLIDRSIICLNVEASPPPPPPTPTPRFDDDDMDAITSYRLMVRVEAKDNAFTIQNAPHPPPPPPPTINPLFLSKTITWA